MFFVVAVALLASASHGASNELRIASPSEFITFAKDSSNCSGTTVYLDSDLDFSGGLSAQFEPKNNFNGIFDGQGHTISNIEVNSSSGEVGLFCYSSGAAIRNVVIDSSCSITSTFVGNDNVFVGSTIGRIVSRTSNVTISGIMNMASVTFEGNATGDSGFLKIGGISGRVSSSSYEATVKNCVNYGTLTHSGTVSASTYIGGIVGQSSGSSSKAVTIQNCLNHGAITSTGSTGDLHIGGIIGESYYTVLINCVSAGRITSSTTTGNIGSIVGSTGITTTITHCLWTSDVGCDNAYGGTGSPSITDSSLVTINTVTVDSLNEYATDNEWNKWLLNTNNNEVTFKVNSNSGFDLSSKLILLPDLDSEWRSFIGWFEDSTYETPFTSTEITSGTTLYGLYGVLVTVTFDANGGSVMPTLMRTVVDGTYGAFPEANRTGHTFAGWFTERAGGTKVGVDTRVTSDHTLYAQWAINKYTTTFDANGGESLSFTSMNVTYNQPYGEFPEVNRTGYTLTGWFTESAGGTKAEAGTTVTSDHTLYAQWAINKYTVAFDLGNGTVVEEQLDFNKTISYPDGGDMRREGYAFCGWDKEDEFVPAHNITIIALWEEVVTENQVEIVFGRKELSEEEIKEIIEKYTDEEFVIVKSEDDKSGETKVIIQFKEKSKAEEFIRNVNEYKREEDSIKTIRSADYDPSFTISLFPQPLSTSLLICF